MEKEDTEVTEEEVRTAIKSTPSKKSAGPDGITSIHLKHLGDKAIKLLARLFTIVINTNTIPQTWKTAKIIPLPKPGKDKTLGKSYRPISLLSNTAKILEKNHTKQNPTLPTRQSVPARIQEAAQHHHSPPTCQQYHRLRL